MWDVWVEYSSIKYRTLTQKSIDTEHSHDRAIWTKAIWAQRRLLIRLQSNHKFEIQSANIFALSFKICHKLAKSCQTRSNCICYKMVWLSSLVTAEDSMFKEECVVSTKRRVISVRLQVICDDTWRLMRQSPAPIIPSLAAARQLKEAIPTW